VSASGPDDAAKYQLCETVFEWSDRALFLEQRSKKRRIFYHREKNKLYFPNGRTCIRKLTERNKSKPSTRREHS